MDIRELMAQTIALEQQGNFTAAEEGCRLAISKAPNYDQVHYLQACIYQRQGKTDAAIASVNTAIDLAPGKAMYMNFLGACYLFRKETVAAELCFRRAIMLEPEAAGSYNNLGLMLLNKKRLDEAYFALQQALKLAPRDVNALCNMGRVCYERDMSEQALASYELACALQPENSTALLGKANCLRQLMRFSEAMELIDRIPLNTENKAELLRHKAMLLNAMGRIDEACEAFDAAPVVLPEAYESASWRAHARKVKSDEPFFHQLQQLESHVGTISGNSKTYLCFALAKAYHDVGNLAVAANYYALGGANALLIHPYNEQNDVALFAATKRNLTAAYVNTLAKSGSDSRRPIFILGMERSGTTLIEQMLASHSAIFAAGEQPFISNVMAGFRLPDGIAYVDDANEYFEPDASLLHRAERYLQKIDALPGNNGQTRFTDKMPDNFKNLGLIRAMFPHACIIHCRRDPVDTCISSYTTQFKAGNQWTYNLAAMGRRYRRYWDLMAYWRREFPGQFLELRYEQVVENTEQAARTLLDWCGLPWDERVLRFYETKRQVLTASVNQVRQPIYTSSIGRWKKWEPYIQPLLAEIGDIEKQYWAELDLDDQAEPERVYAAPR